MKNLYCYIFGFLALPFVMQAQNKMLWSAKIGHGKSWNYGVDLKSKLENSTTGTEYIVYPTPSNHDYQQYYAKPDYYSIALAYNHILFFQYGSTNKYFRILRANFDK